MCPVWAGNSQCESKQIVLDSFISTDTEGFPPPVTQYCQVKGPLTPWLTSTMLQTQYGWTAGEEKLPFHLSVETERQNA